MNKTPGDHFKTERLSANRSESVVINGTGYLLKQIPLMYFQYFKKIFLILGCKYASSNTD